MMSIFHLHKLQRNCFALQPPGMKATVPVQPAAPLGTRVEGRVNSGQVRREFGEAENNCLT